MTVVLVGATLAAYAEWRAKVDQIGHLEIADTTQRPPQYTNALNILLVGSDTRAGHNAAIGGRVGCDCSDTLMLVHISPGRGRVVVLSIPRDTEIPQYKCDPVQGYKGQAADPAAMQQINWTLEFGGPECTRHAVEEQTGIYINNVIQLDFTGFQKAINDVGGVTICVPAAVNDPVTPGPNGHGSGLVLKAGKDHIWGAQALQFWRARYALADGGDLARIERDQYLMGQVFKGVLHSGLLSSPSKIFHVVSDIAAAMYTDASLTDLVHIASSLTHLSAKDMQFITAPTVPDPALPAQLLFEQPQANGLFAALAHDKTLPKAPLASRSKTKGGGQALTITPDKVKVEVLNGSNAQGVAARTATSLTGRGFHVLGDAQATTASGADIFNQVSTVIEYSSAKDLAAANTLREQFKSATVKLVPTLTAGTVTVILGSSFTKLAPRSKSQSQPLGNLAGSFSATNACRNSAFFGPNLPQTGRAACAC